MTVSVIDIADAVAEELNDPLADFSQSFTAKRMVLPYFDIGELENLKVSIVPTEKKMESLTRSADLAECEIDVGVQKKVSVDNEDEIVALIELTDEIARYMRGRKLRSQKSAVWLRSEIDPIYSPEHLAQHKCFTSLLRITYKYIDDDDDE